MKKLITTLFISCCSFGTLFIPAEASATKIKVEPSVTFHNSYARTHHYDQRIVRRHYQEVYRSYDPISHQEFYYSYPVTREYVEYYPVYRSHQYSTGTDFNLKFKFK